METKKSKYDTNPLDPDFVKKADEVWTEADDRPETKEVGGATREIGTSANENARNNVYSEAPTRRYDNIPLDSPYRSIFVPPPYSQPTPFQSSPATYPRVDQRPTSRPVPGIGLPEKWAMTLAYAPFYIGVVVSLLELLLVPRSEPRVRFHAAQALSLNIAMLVVQTLFGVVEALTDNSVGSSLFGAACTIFLLVSMKRVWNGRPHHIAPVTEPTEWFNEHIKPRSKD